MIFQALPWLCLRMLTATKNYKSKYMRVPFAHPLATEFTLWPWLGQKVNELLLPGRHQCFLQSIQVLRLLAPDQLQQVLVGFLIELDADDVLVLLFGQVTVAS